MLNYIFKCLATSLLAFFLAFLLGCVLVLGFMIATVVLGSLL